MKGEVFPAEISRFTDPVTGVAVRQLTRYKAHSHHLYFTNPGWYDAGRRLLFASDRANRTNLFSLDLASHEITPLTDLDPLPPPTEVQFIDACVNPQRAEAYFWYGRALIRQHGTGRSRCAAGACRPRCCRPHFALPLERPHLDCGRRRNLRKTVALEARSTWRMSSILRVCPRCVRRRLDGLARLIDAGWF